jgi:uncharacterized protein with PIN domain
MKSKSNLSSDRAATPAAGPQDAPPLLADAMLGTLARWLRQIGYDTIYARDWSDHQVVARARAEGRLVLTRDHELARRQGIDCLLIESQDLESQLEEVRQALGPLPTGLEPRCPTCNGVLREIARDEVRERVPAYVYRTYERFRYCARCDQLYWPGSHWKDVQSTLKRLR